MQYFTFHRTADELRLNVRTWQVAGTAEAVGVGLVVFFFLEGKKMLIMLAVLLVYFCTTMWVYARPLLRRHSLSETTLTRCF